MEHNGTQITETFPQRHQLMSRKWLPARIRIRYYNFSALCCSLSFIRNVTFVFGVQFSEPGHCSIIIAPVLPQLTQHYMIKFACLVSFYSSSGFVYFTWIKTTVRVHFNIVSLIRFSAVSSASRWRRVCGCYSAERRVKLPFKKQPVTSPQKG